MVLISQISRGGGIIWFSVAKATLESQMSVSLSIGLISIAQNAYIKPLDDQDHWAYQPLVFFRDF